MKTLHQTVQAIAQSIPRYPIFKCDRYAAKLLEELKSKGIHGQIVRLSADSARGFIVPKNPSVLLPFNVSLNTSISSSGHHWRILVEKTVYEQLIPEGVAFSDWASHYDCDTHRFSVSVVASFKAE